MDGGFFAASGLFEVGGLFDIGGLLEAGALFEAGHRCQGRGRFQASRIVWLSGRVQGCHSVTLPSSLAPTCMTWQRSNC